MRRTFNAEVKPGVVVPEIEDYGTKTQTAPHANPPETTSTTPQNSPTSQQNPPVLQSTPPAQEVEKPGEKEPEWAQSLEAPLTTPQEEELEEMKRQQEQSQQRHSRISWYSKLAGVDEAQKVIEELGIHPKIYSGDIVGAILDEIRIFLIDIGVWVERDLASNQKLIEDILDAIVESLKSTPRIGGRIFKVGEYNHESFVYDMGFEAGKTDEWMAPVGTDPAELTPAWFDRWKKLKYWQDTYGSKIKNIWRDLREADIHVDLEDLEETFEQGFLQGLKARGQTRKSVAAVVGKKDEQLGPISRFRKMYPDGHTPEQWAKFYEENKAEIDAVSEAAGEVYTQAEKMNWKV